MLLTLPFLLPAVFASAATISPRNSEVGARWQPGSLPIRGVNLGSQFIIEPWMAKDEWRSMGCINSTGGALADEWSCVKQLGQDKANAVWKKHWETWIDKTDIQKIHDYKLNTIRIPVGFWIKEELVQSDEFYPRGGLTYLDRIVGWASDLGLQIIIDLHGAPGSQSYKQAFTGLETEKPGFYTGKNFERTYQFLEWMVQRIHTKREYRNVYALQVLNEPVTRNEKDVDNPNDKAANMVWNFYPAAWRRIRAREDQLKTESENRVHIIFMGSSWGSGDPASNLTNVDRTFMGIDDHKYYKWDGAFASATKQQYLDAACRDDHGTSRDTVVGEWSLGVHTDLQDRPGWAPSGATDATKAWYRRYWAAQASSYERAGGWVFWSWKCNWLWDSGTDDWRWCYESAVRNGVIPDDATVAKSLSPC